MKFTVPSSDLLKKLQVAAGAIGSMNVLPVLEDFLFNISDNSLTITASDMEIFISTKMEVVSDTDGAIAIPAKILLDTLKALPAQPVSFSVDEESFAIEITSSYGKYKLAGEDGDGFPDIPSVEEADDTVTIQAPQLNNAITHTLFATSNDELRPAMTGIYFQVDFSKVTFVATDAHKLVKYTVNELDSQVSTSFIVPKKALNLLKNILPPGDEVKISFNQANAFFKFEDSELVCRLIDTRYPDYNAVIPVDNPNLLTLSRQDFQNSLRRIAIYANKTTNQVILNLSENSLTLSARDLDFSNEATEQLSCSYDGEPMQIAFNAKFLIEMLTVLESDDVKLELATYSRAGILLPTEMDENEEILMLLMPVLMG